MAGHVTPCELAQKAGDWQSIFVQKHEEQVRKLMQTCTKVNPSCDQILYWKKWDYELCRDVTLTKDPKQPYVTKKRGFFGLISWRSTAKPEWACGNVAVAAWSEAVKGVPAAMVIDALNGPAPEGALPPAEFYHRGHGHRGQEAGGMT